MPSKRAPRRHHGADLKAKVLAACDEPGASVAAVALAHELNANLVHKWRRGRSAATPLAPAGRAPEFVALSLPTPASIAPEPQPAPSQDIRVAIERGRTTISVSWPVTSAGACAAWLHELLR